jgi:Protein of unknown function (DUF3109)
MIIIQDVLISSEIVTEQFQCHLEKCKGACCTEGDYGAPLNKGEMEKLDELLPQILPFLPERSQAYLSDNPGYEYYTQHKIWGTSCHDDGACVYLTVEDDGIAFCGIEKAYYTGKIDFMKPISCHMYPIRVSTNEIAGFEAWNYDRWDICNAACSLGASQKMPIYKFLKNAIVRAKGLAFYDELLSAADFVTE